MKRTFLLHHGMPTRNLSLVILVLGTLLLWLPCSWATDPITPSGLLHTEVGPPILIGPNTQYNITGGTRPGGVTGTNLFHSFGDFNVPTNNIANFHNVGSVDLNGNVFDFSLPTSNILGTVTGVNPSIIFGMIQTNGPGGFGNANLFLMNPHGFLFGPNATVNVGGMVSFTTANYLRLTDTGIFHANPAATSVLTSAPVAAFGFLGSNPAAPAAISIQGSTLAAPGQTISLVGGNQGFTYTNPDTDDTASVPDGMTMTGGRLSAPGGQINLVSVASAGEVLNGTLEPAPNINGNVFTAMGDISLSQGATLTVSGDAAGTVRIRGGQFVIADSTIMADTINTNGGPVAIDIQVAGDMSISHTSNMPVITARTTGIGNDAREVQISSGNLRVVSTATPNDRVNLIDTHTSDTGRAGNVTITTGNLEASVASSRVVFIETGITGAGHGGDVTITATNHAQFENTTIDTGDSPARSLRQIASGSAGNLTITADSLQLNNTALFTDAFSASAASQQAGDITLNVRDINMNSGAISAIGVDRGGAITVNADRLVTDFTIFETDTISGLGGGITVNARTVELTNGSTLVSTTVGDGNAGDVYVTATDHLSLIGHADGQDTLGLEQPTGLYSNSFGDFGGQGNAGNIVVNTPRLEMTVGSRITAATASSGHGGNVTIFADTISISGEFPNPGALESTIWDIKPLAPSGVFSTTVGSDFCSVPCGNAGHISITTRSLVMDSGAQIDSSTSNNGRGGDITIHATNGISMSGTLSDGSPVGVFSRTIGTAPDSNSGGNIALTAGQSVTISNGASVSASSTGPGDTGNIQIDAGNQFTMTNSSVTTEANQASGGAIKITTNPSGTVQLTNSTISASVLDGAGGGGSVNIDPQFVILLNSQILANAVQGPGGNISITTNFLLPDANSVISASSQFGVNGTVTIQSPNAPISGQIQPLGKSPLLATSLLNQRCASLAGGEFSSFTVAGRDSLPTEPGGWLASPLYAAGGGLGIKAEGVQAEGQWLEGMSASAGRGARGESLFSSSGLFRASNQRNETNQINQMDQTVLSLRKIAPAGFLTQAFAVEGSSSCQS